MTERCNNFPCQLSARHPGLCSSTGDGECFSDEERHARIQSLIAAEDDSAHYQRMLNPEVFLARIDSYLTERCDLAYVRYYRASRYDGGTGEFPAMFKAQQAWNDLGDARELVRRPLRELQQAKLKGTRTVDGRILR